MSMVVLNRDQGYVGGAISYSFSVLGGQVLRVHVISYNFRLDAKQPLVKLDGGLKVFHGLQVLHVTDMLAQEGILITGEAEGILKLGTAGKHLPCPEGKVNGVRCVTPGTPD